MESFHRVDSVTSRLPALLWLYNPLVFMVSSRGNAESVTVCLILLTLHLFRERVFVLAGSITFNFCFD